MLMLTCDIGKERKIDKNRKIKAMTLSLNPTIQSLILHMYVPHLKILACTVQEKTVTQVSPYKTEKWTNKGKNKSKELDSQSQNTITHCPCVYQVSTL